MPDFVRRLEDALYRTAHSKVSAKLKNNGVSDLTNGRAASYKP